MAVGSLLSSSAAMFQLNGETLGGFNIDDLTGGFASLAGGTTGSYDTVLSSSINS